MQQNKSFEIKSPENYEIPEKLFIEKESPAEKVQAPTEKMPMENNIEQLYKFLDVDHQSQGYEDALINPDSSHLDQNVDELKKELNRTIGKVKTYYEDYITEINFHIESRGRRGMVDTVEELTMKRSIAQSHISKVIEIEKDAVTSTGDSQGIILSYTRGFNNGLAAITHHSMIKGNL